MNSGVTLARRVTRWSALVVALSLVTCGGGGALFLYQRAVRQLDRELQQVASHFFEQKRLHGGTEFDLRNQHEIAEWLPPPSAATLVEVEQAGTVYYRSPRLGDTALPRTSKFRFEEWAPARIRLGSVREGDIIVRVAAPVDQLNELARSLLLVFSLGLPVVIGFVVLGGRSIARQALGPVRQIADSAERITSHELDRRVPVPSAEDDIRRLALVLNATLDRLETSFRQARQFSADASHELKTPLASLHAELEALLASPTLAEHDRASVADALETTQHLIAIIESLLLLARADAGRLHLETQAIDLSELVRDCLEDTRIVADAAGLKLDTVLISSAPVRGDPTRLRQIIANLLSNAVKYNMPGGYLSVRLAAEQSGWTLEVGNSGPGISPEHQPHVFDRFYRAEHHALVPGHGLGLAISRELARAQGGELTLLRSDSSATWFRLALPAADGPPGQPP